LSRNQLKLPDLIEAQEFVRGDPLLRLDRRLATLLDGVYRPGEFYLRWLERFTALGFGTVNGRKLSRYFVFPFGGALLPAFAVAPSPGWFTGKEPPTPTPLSRPAFAQSIIANRPAPAEAAASTPGDAAKPAQSGKPAELPPPNENKTGPPSEPAEKKIAS